MEASVSRRKTMRTKSDGTYVTVTPSRALSQSPNFDTKWAKAAFIALLEAAGVTGSYTVRAHAGIPGSPGKSKQIRFKLKQGVGAGRPILEVKWQSGHNGTAFEGQLTASSIDAVDINEQLLLAHPNGVYTYSPEKQKAFEPDIDTVIDIALELCALAGSRSDRAVEITGLSKLNFKLESLGYSLDDARRWLIKEGHALPAPSEDLFAYIEPSLFRIIDPTYGETKVAVEVPTPKAAIGAIGILQELKALRVIAAQYRELTERIDTLQARRLQAEASLSSLMEAQAELDARLADVRQTVERTESEIKECQAKVQDPEMLAAVEALNEFETLFRAGS